MVAAELRLPSKTPRTEKEACVDAVIAAMGLSKAAGTYIGEATLPSLDADKQRERMGS